MQLIATSLEIGKPNVVEDIKDQISRAHFGIADITGNNPNVMWELGYMCAARKEVIILKDKADSERTPFDLYGQYRVDYHIAKDDSTGRTEYALLEAGIGRHMDRIIAECRELREAEKMTEGD